MPPDDAMRDEEKEEEFGLGLLDGAMMRLLSSARRLDSSMVQSASTLEASRGGSFSRTRRRSLTFSARSISSWSDSVSNSSRFRIRLFLACSLLRSLHIICRWNKDDLNKI